MEEFSRKIISQILSNFCLNSATLYSRDRVTLRDKGHEIMDDQH